MITAYFSHLHRSIVESWENFWFQPLSSVVAGRVRVAVSIALLFWLGQWWLECGNWVGANGLLTTTTWRELIGAGESGTGATFRWTPLIWIDSPAAAQIYLGGTIALTIAMAAGLGGRYLVLLVWLLCLGWIHRVSVLTGIAEPLATMLLAYLVIDPGKTTNLAKPGIHDNNARTSARIAVRLVQVHFVAFLVLMCLSQLASPVWWSGEAAWWLAVQDRSFAFRADDLHGHPLLINALTHSVLACELLTIIFLLRPILRPLGYFSAIMLSLILATVANEPAFAVFLLAGTSAFMPPQAKAIFDSNAMS